ncbi:MAG: zinc ribbon domain-containing protein [Methanolinea sp.]|nr:zinc ribbon domain-containing protein [Methanolinea sp.]
MSDNQNPGYDSMTGEEEPQGPERYLRQGEELLIYTTDIQIKKFRFDAYLTNTRLFLTDQNEKTPGVTAKEIPIDSVADTYLEHSQAQEPILVLSIRTSDDDIRTMKMVFVHTGADRLSQAEEWIHLIRHGLTKPSTPGGTAQSAARSPTPVISPEARALSETMIFPEKTTVEPGRIPTPEPMMTPREEKARVPPPTPPAHAPPGSRPAVKPIQDASTTQIQFCYHCGHRLPPNANFCPYCGTRMHQTPSPSGPHIPLHTPRAAEEPRNPVEKEKKKRLGWLFKRK